MHVPQWLVELVVMARSSDGGRRGSLAALIACALGCGGAEADGPPQFGPLPSPVQRAAAPATPLPETPLSPAADPENTTGANLPPEPDDGKDMPTRAPSAIDPEAGLGCKPAPGVSGAPETISEAIALLNGLPRPTSLACFIEALDRPLTLYMTKSDDSLQPSPGARSPRAFILRGDLEMSIVLDGSARDTLEFGFRPEPRRSIKAEILFPVSGDVSETSLFDRVQVTPRTTKCGACHVGEAHEDYPGFPLGVFASDVLAPYDFDEVSLPSLSAEAQSCDRASEPYRCGLLSALFDHGSVVPGTLPEPQ